MANKYDDINPELAEQFFRTGGWEHTFHARSEDTMNGIISFDAMTTTSRRRLLYDKKPRPVFSRGRLRGYSMDIVHMGDIHVDLHGKTYDVNFDELRDIMEPVFLYALSTGAIISANVSQPFDIVRTQDTYFAQPKEKLVWKYPTDGEENKNV